MEALEQDFRYDDGDGGTVYNADADGGTVMVSRKPILIV
ncbi:MAG: hypothetical protein RLZZ234_112 [Candidatus Parcubacteria bacterium]|jgi:hypothetical protein